MNESSSSAVVVRRSRAEGERLVQEFEQSGETRKAFCQSRGIAPHRLDYYRQKQKSRGRAGTGALVPVELVGPVGWRGSPLRVELPSGLRICVEAGFDAQLLKRLVATLEG
jgi:hypothetical protein